MLVFNSDFSKSVANFQPFSPPKDCSPTEQLLWNDFLDKIFARDADIFRDEFWTVAATFTGTPRLLPNNLFFAAYNLSKIFPRKDLRNMKKTEDEISKALMIPLEELVIPVDKLSDWLFDQVRPSGNALKMFEGKFRGKNISSTVTFTFGAGPLNSFDKAVLLAFISEYCAGNNFVSVQRLYETLGGSNHLTAPTRKQLLKSVRKLMTTAVKIDMTELVAKVYPKSKKRYFEGALLPCKIATAEINGKLTDSVIHMLDNSILLEVADVKSQIARLPVGVISNSPMRGTLNLIALRWYLLERVTEIVGSHSRKRTRKLQPVILFDSILEKMKLTNLDRYKLRDLRENVKKILADFKTCGYISDFEFVKKNGSNHSINIVLPEKPPLTLTNKNPRTDEENPRTDEENPRTDEENPQTPKNMA